MISKDCASFTDCISEINNTEIDNAKDLNFVILMYELIEYSDNYSEILQVCGNITKTIQMII